MLGKDASSLDARFTRNAQQAVDKSYGEIYRILIEKGYQVNQLDGWDSRVSFSTDLGLYFLMTYTAGFADWDDKFVKNLDVREELQKLTSILVNGVPVAPVGFGTPVGGITYGIVKASQLTRRDRERLR